MYANPKTKDHACGKAFLIALGIAALIFLPFVIWDKGYFFFFGDFNVQQIPFYKLAHEAIRTGDWNWNWFTDLGANFIGSYSFYLLGSPFFWLTLPFPTEFVPYLMAPLLVLKHASAAAFATLYLKRFLRNPNYAVFGGLLYAFSGFAVYNIFFNHFHEAFLFFPLLLYGMEALVEDDRRGIFAFAVAINAFVNYWFFIGEVVFVLLYFAVRTLSSGWKMSFGKFFWIGFESVIGMLLASCLFIPSVMAIMGNPRTGAEELISGWNFWLYWHNQLYPAIVSSAFFPPDLPSRPNLFPDRGAKWASLSAWLPMVGMVGVIAYLKSKRDWLRNLLLVSFLFALIPGLNSMFILFNNSYYARWYYMPLLLMALATAIALENRSIDLRFGFQCSIGFMTLMIAILGLTPTIQSGGTLEWGLSKYPERFAAVAAIGLLSLLAFWLLVHRYRNRSLRFFTRILTGALGFVIVVYSVTFIGMGKSHSDDPDFLREVALDGRYQINLPEPEVFSRVDIYDGMDNLGMYWHLPNIQAFHSIIPVSTMEFYPKVGVKRDVSSKPETKYYQLRSLLSVRWLFVEEEKQMEDLMPGWTLRDNQLGFEIYENDNFIPMGFTYDYFITEDDFDLLTEEDRAAALMRVMVLGEEDAAAHNDLMERMPQQYYQTLTEEDFVQDARNRRNTAGHFFARNNEGFVSKIRLERENLVFYSVPYDEGWSATVNGQPAEIIKASIGFMAVRAPAGENEIRFTYTAPGLRLGVLLSAAGLLILIGYLLLWKRYGKPSPQRRKLYEGENPDQLWPQEHPQEEWLIADDVAETQELPPPPQEWFEKPQMPSKEEKHDE